MRFGFCHVRSTHVGVREPGGLACCRRSVVVLRGPGRVAAAAPGHVPTPSERPTTAASCCRRISCRHMSWWMARAAAIGFEPAGRGSASPVAAECVALGPGSGGGPHRGRTGGDRPTLRPPEAPAPPAGRLGRGFVADPGWAPALGRARAGFRRRPDPGGGGAGCTTATCSIYGGSSAADRDLPRPGPDVHHRRGRGEPVGDQRLNHLTVAA